MVAADYSCNSGCPGIMAVNEPITRERFVYVGIIP